MKNLDH